MNHLDEARERIDRASEVASGPVHTQLNSIDIGVAEEEGGGSTQDEPGPKMDRLVEVTEKLEGLHETVENDETRRLLEEAVDNIQAYMSEHPQNE